jgi:Arabinose efflux permease
MDDARIFSKREQRLVLLASCLAIFATPLMGTMVNLALPTLGSEFGISTSQEGWVIAVYFLSSVAFMVPIARLSDLYGKRRMFIIGIFITIAGAILASFSPNFTALLTCRVIMGLGSAAISCTGIAMLTEVYPKNHRGGAIGLNTASVYLGSSVGPPLGGFLTDTLGWHSTFYMVIPFCLLALIAILAFKTDFTPSKGEHFDVKGSVVYGVAITIATYGLMSITEWYSIPLMIFGIALLGVFYLIEKRESFPVLNVKLFSNSRYTRSVAAALLNYASSFAVAFFLSLYLQDVGGYTPSQAGMVLLIQPLIQAVFTPLTGRLSDRVDARILPTIGMIITCAGLMVIVLLTREVDIMLVAFALILLGTGYALFSAPNTNAVMATVSPREYSEASGMLGIMRQGGILLSIGIAVGCVSLIVGNGSIDPATIDLFMNAMRTAFLIFVGMSVVGCVLSWFRGKPVKGENTPNE